MQCILVEFKFLHITVRFKVNTFFVEYIYKMLIEFPCNQSSKKTLQEPDHLFLIMINNNNKLFEQIKNY